MKRALAFALAAAALAACEDPPPSPRPDFGRAAPTPPAEALPTPVPPPEGVWALEIVSTEDSCGYGAPPETVALAGDGLHFQIALQSFFIDAQGLLTGDDLALRGSSLLSYRPTYDCVIEEQDVWALRRTEPTTLEGELLRLRDHRSGDECVSVLREGSELPCITRWVVRLAAPLP